MLFTLEALQARHGDCLLLHLGDPAAPDLVLIDGGPAGVWHESLEPRLAALRDERTPDDTLPIRLLMVSHVDADHIDGILDLTGELVQAREDHLTPRFRVEAAWHNSFDDIVGDRADQLVGAAIGQLTVADIAGAAPAALPVSRETALVLASVAQGQRLRDDLERLAIAVNGPVGELVLRDGDGVVHPELFPGVTVTVVGPARSELLRFQEEWDKKVAKQQRDAAELADFSDKSAYNLASIVVLVEAGGKSMLLTGDARGDHLLKGLRELGLLDDGRLHVDLLKLPHHGSDRNVDTDFFRAVTADHYVVSGDGGHGNPELATFEMLLAARRDDDRPFTLHLTYAPEACRAYHGKPYPAAELRALFARHRDAGRKLTVVTPEPGAAGVTVALLDASRP